MCRVAGCCVCCCLGFCCGCCVCRGACGAAGVYAPLALFRAIFLIMASTLAIAGPASPSPVCSCSSKLYKNENCSCSPRLRVSVCIAIAIPIFVSPCHVLLPYPSTSLHQSMICDVQCCGVSARGPARMASDMCTLVSMLDILILVMVVKSTCAVRSRISSSLTASSSISVYKPCGSPCFIWDIT